MIAAVERPDQHDLAGRPRRPVHPHRGGHGYTLLPRGLHPHAGHQHQRYIPLKCTALHISRA